MFAETCVCLHAQCQCSVLRDVNHTCKVPTHMLQAATIKPNRNPLRVSLQMLLADGQTDRHGEAEGAQ